MNDGKTGVTNMVKKRGIKAQFDWETIEREYRTNTYSDAELSRRHGCSRGAIQKHAKNGHWERDLSVAVSQATSVKLLQEDAKVAVLVAGRNATQDRETVDLASDTRVGVVRSHRKDINQLREIEKKILEELGDSPRKLYITQYQGGIVKEEVAIAVTERAAALNNLANVQHKRIQLERQAFSIDDMPPQQSSIDDVLAAVAKARRPLVVDSDDQQD